MDTSQTVIVKDNLGKRISVNVNANSTYGDIIKAVINASDEKYNIHKLVVEGKEVVPYERVNLNLLRGLNTIHYRGRRSREHKLNHGVDNTEHIKFILTVIWDDVPVMFKQFISLYPGRTMLRPNPPTSENYWTDLKTVDKLKILQEYLESYDTQQSGGTAVWLYKAKKYHYKIQQKLQKIKNNGGTVPKEYEQYLKPFDSK
jgi:hypothetical protein